MFALRLAQFLLDVPRPLKLIWPSAQRALEWLNEAKTGLDTASTQVMQRPERHKRQADDAFGTDTSTEYHHSDAFTEYETGNSAQISNDTNMSTRIMAEMLGLELPGISPPSLYTSGYEWWPRVKHEASSSSSSSSMNTFSTSPTGSNFSSHDTNPWLRGTPGSMQDYSFDLPPPPTNFSI